MPNKSLATKHEAQIRVQSSGKTTTLMPYPKVVNYPLRTFATDENIADYEDKITTFTQPLNKTPSQDAEKLVLKALRSGDVYGGHELEEIFIQKLDKSIRQCLRGYWGLRQLATLHDLAFHATSLLKLQGMKQRSSNSQVGLNS